MPLANTRNLLRRGVGGRLGTRPRLARSGCAALVSAALCVSVFGSGCRRKLQYRVTVPPSAASEVRDIDVPAPRVRLSIQITDFVVRDDTLFPEDQRALLRRTEGVAFANALHEALGLQGGFARIVRKARPAPDETDLTLEGEYRLFIRLGPGAKGSIPYYGRYASIGGAWTRERVSVVVRKGNGQEIWRGEFEDEHRQVRRAIEQASVPWRTPEFVARIAARIVTEAAAESKSSDGSFWADLTVMGRAQ